MTPRQVEQLTGEEYAAFVRYANRQIRAQNRAARRGSRWRATRRSSSSTSPRRPSSTPPPRRSAARRAALAPLPRKAFVPATIALGALGVASKKAVDAASGLNEQIAASSVVFGKSAKSVQAWGKTGAQAFGLSQTRSARRRQRLRQHVQHRRARQEDRSPSMSKSMVQLAGDMASFHDQDPSDMLDALRSGLSGEAEPLQEVRGADDRGDGQGRRLPGRDRQDTAPSSPRARRSRPATR